MPQEEQHPAGQMREPIPTRAWERLNDNERPIPHTLDRVTENVSPISATSNDEIPMDEIPMSAVTMGSEPRVFTAEDYSVPHVPAVPQVVEVKRKTMAAEPQFKDEKSSLETSRKEPVINLGSRFPTQTYWKNVLVNVVFLVIPIPFFALAIALAALDGKPTQDRQNWDSFQSLMKIAGTLFPITFALLAGRAIAKTGSYALENGVALGTLEQIFGSRTVSSAISTQYQLRSFNTLGFGLVALWILSPIGSQGYLRLVSPAASVQLNPTMTPYFNTDTESKFAEGNSIFNTNSPVQSSIFTSMFTGALLGTSQTKIGPTDLWTNVKIPYLSSLQQVNDGSTWVTISPNDTVIYSSLVGIPISGLGTGETEFSMESSYMELDCGDINSTQPVELQDFAPGFDKYATPFSSSNGTYRGSNTNVTVTANSTTTATWSIGLDNFISPKFSSSLSTGSTSKTCQSGNQGYLASPCYLRNLSESQVLPGTLLFQSEPTVSEESASLVVQAASCPIQQVYVQSKIVCNQEPSASRRCRVVAQRQSQNANAPSFITPLSFPEIFEPISLHLPRAFGAALSGTRSDPSIFYLNNPSPSLIINGDGAVDLSHTPAQALSQRLGQILNTYYTLSQAYPLIAESSPVLIADNLTALSTNTLSEDVYHVSWSWFTFLFLATLVMFLSSLLATLISHKTLNPEILGYCSSLVRDSSYLELPMKSGRAGGAHLSRMNKEFRLKMGQIGHSESAHLAVLKEEDAIQTRQSRIYNWTSKPHPLDFKWDSGKTSMVRKDLTE
ncbi:hypothetical protein G7Y89_g8190 [Cudoniella acicularis]|uniref:Uncharacterized protein n=1 Tax=Cudoniella acicularis TaxID=354080 RepID=A0A8H4RKP0_9HELO|nr:hypothetical protein G7Y89_g8190 [Cudoniella acicularis]